ncbi:DUF2182 domain-containing protein [Halosimplex aquaticum]|uniref:DUF2182 domain-containing protein n=1 Tax=Halosimplex aquaticum TaxID=3026162 RepID=A0ABD5Y3K2_9EURY|nr:DUF2182 domain-containing protein [Halosimplex aquaticum]
MTAEKQLRQYRDRLTDAVLPERVPPAAVGVTLVTVALWAVVLGGRLPHPPMPGPMTAPGVPEAMGTSNGAAGVIAYLAMWGTMMSAMMYPSMLPLVREYVRGHDDAGVAENAGIVAVLATYSLAWTATGTVPLALDTLVSIRGLAAAHGPLLVGALGLFVAGYQQTELKRASLRNCCRVPDLDDSGLSVREGARRGLEHGLQCVRATWPLFALLVVSGSMNAAVMLALTVVVVAERLPPWRGEVATAVGVAAGVGGIAVVLFPGLIP